jgi:hypothetical protein
LFIFLPYLNYSAKEVGSSVGHCTQKKPYLQNMQNRALGEEQYLSVNQDASRA